LWTSFQKETSPLVEIVPRVKKKGSRFKSTGSGAPDVDRPSDEVGCLHHSTWNGLLKIPQSKYDGIVPASVSVEMTIGLTGAACIGTIDLALRPGLRASGVVYWGTNVPSTPRFFCTTRSMDSLLRRAVAQPEIKNIAKGSSLVSAGNILIQKMV